MNFQELKDELEAGIRRPVYILTGEERAVLFQYVRKIAEQPKRSDSLKSIIPQLNSNNLFSGKSTYLIEDDKEASEMHFVDILKVCKGNTLILVYRDIDKRKKLFKSAEDEIVTFERFSPEQLVWYVQKQLDVTDTLASMIAAYCGCDVARIDNEVDKLARSGEEITQDLVSQLIHPPVEDRVFEMVDYACKRNASAVFFLYRDLLELGTSPVQIIGLLYSKFKQLFLVQTYTKLNNRELGGKTGLTFFQINSTRPLIGAFTSEHILHILACIQQAEVNVKTGRMSQQLSLDALLVEIVG